MDHVQFPLISNKGFSKDADGQLREYLSRLCNCFDMRQLVLKRSFLRCRFQEIFSSRIIFRKENGACSSSFRVKKTPLSWYGYGPYSLKSRSILMIRIMSSAALTKRPMTSVFPRGTVMWAPADYGRLMGIDEPVHMGWSTWWNAWSIGNAGREDRPDQQEWTAGKTGW